MARPLELEELVEHFTLYPDETRLLRNKSGATRLGFSLSLKFLLWKARFPRGRGELPDNMIEFVAGQVGVPAADIGFSDWEGRQVKRHRAEIRRVTGFRECSVADAENLTAWLAAHVCCREQRADRVREELLGQCRAEKIEPPAGTRIGRIIGSALQRADDTLTARISGQIPPDAQKRMVDLIAAASDNPGADAGDEADGREVFAAIRSDPGNVSLNTARAEVAKLASITAIGLPGGGGPAGGPGSRSRRPAICAPIPMRSSSRCWPPACTAARPRSPTP